MRNDYLGIQCDLEWIKPRKWNGRPQGDFIKTADGRFTVCKNMRRDVPIYTAWDRDKKCAEYEAHPFLTDRGGNVAYCMMGKFDNGWLGEFHFLQEAVTMCEMQLETMNSMMST